MSSPPPPPPAAAADTLHIFPLYNPQSTSRAALFVTTVNLQGVHKNSLSLKN